MAKKLTFSQQKVNFFALVVRLSQDFEYGKICRIDGLFAKVILKFEVVNFGENYLLGQESPALKYVTANDLKSDVTN